MTKQELIAKLADVPDDAEVRLERFGDVEFSCEYAYWNEVLNVLFLSGDY